MLWWSSPSSKRIAVAYFCCNFGLYLYASFVCILASLSFVPVSVALYLYASFFCIYVLLSFSSMWIFHLHPCVFFIFMRASFVYICVCIFRCYVPLSFFSPESLFVPMFPRLYLCLSFLPVFFCVSFMCKCVTPSFLSL